jgi:hypothetical protein
MKKSYILITLIIIISVITANRVLAQNVSQHDAMNEFDYNYNSYQTSDITTILYTKKVK